jgi:hypothetical protein
MNTLQTLLLVWAAGGVISRDGDCLRVEASKGAIPSKLLDMLRDNKTELLAILPPVRDRCAAHMPPVTDR